MSAASDAARYVRAVLTPAERKARERRTDLSGIGYLGGVVFVDGVAYVERGSYVHTTLSRRYPLTFAALEDADQAGLDGYTARVAELTAPKSNPVRECTPGYCPRGGRAAGHNCRSHYPHNFPPVPEPPQRVVHFPSRDSRSAR